MKQLRRLWDITRKDLLVISKDKGAWILLLVTPLAVMLVASMALGPAFSGQLKSQLLVTNLDQGVVGKQLLDGLGATEGLNIVEADADETRALKVGDTSYKTGLIIPADFSSQILTGSDTGLSVFVDPNDNTNRPFMVGMISGAASRLSGMVVSVRVSVAEVLKFAPDAEPTVVAVDAAPAAVKEMTGNPPVAVEINNAAGLQEVNMFDTQTPGYAVMFLLFGVMLGGKGFNDILPQAAALLIYGIVCFGIGIKMFKFRNA